jgi:hypothetical protein
MEIFQLHKLRQNESSGIPSCFVPSAWWNLLNRDSATSLCIFCQLHSTYTSWSDIWTVLVWLQDTYTSKCTLSGTYNLIFLLHSNNNRKWNHCIVNTYVYFSFNLFYYQSFYSPMNAQVIVLKTILKFTLKYLRHVSVQTHHLQVAQLSVLAKVTLRQSS